MGFPHYSTDCADFHPSLNRPVLAEIDAERVAQDEKWGVQIPPGGDGTGPDVPLTFGASTMGGLASVARRYCDRTHQEGRGEWWSILMEEVAEALAEDDPAKLRKELVQVAA